MDEINKITKPANIKQTSKILEQMKNCICKIHITGKENGTGFFTNFSYNNKNYCVLISNYHIIDEDYLKNNNSIKLSFNDDQEFKTILLNNDRIKYYSKQFDITMIEIKESDKINTNKYLEIEDNLFSKDIKTYYEGKSIYSLQYKDVALVSHGLLKEIREHEMIHYCPSEYGSSGAPLLCLSNNKVIGMHKQTATYFNKGELLVFPIYDFIKRKIIERNIDNVKETKIEEKAHNNNNETKIGENDGNNNTTKKEIISEEKKIKNDENKNKNKNDINNDIQNEIESNDKENQKKEEIIDKTNEIIITLKVTKKDVNNKNIYFLDNSGIFKDGQYHYHEHLKELDETNTELFINDKQIKYQKYFLAEKEGTYTIKLKFTTLIQDCSYMFSNCKCIEEIDLSNLDTRNITNMKRMFYDCDNIIKINFSYFDTRNVDNMECIFGNCKSLENIDLSYFDTRNVINMKNMFNSCKKLKAINLSNFNTEKVHNMQCMFYGCENLLNINVSSFNTKNVSNMISMFDGCYKLNEINVSSFNIQNVTDMEKMFNCCYNLESLDLSSFNLVIINNIENILYGCDKLKIIRVNKNCSEKIKQAINQINNVRIIIV